MCVYNFWNQKCFAPARSVEFGKKSNKTRKSDIFVSKPDVVRAQTNTWNRKRLCVCVEYPSAERDAERRSRVVTYSLRGRREECGRIGGLHAAVPVDVGARVPRPHRLHGARALAGGAPPGR